VQRVFAANLHAKKKLGFVLGAENYIMIKYIVQIHALFNEFKKSLFA
jgi:hypothetical protein